MKESDKYWHINTEQGRLRRTTSHTQIRKKKITNNQFDD